jgi:hypothetical protein
MVAAFSIVIQIGNLSDKVRAKFLIPIAFTIVSSAMFLIYFIPHLSKGLLPLYVAVTLIMIGSVFAITSIESVFSRNLPKEIRGTMNGL